MRSSAIIFSFLFVLSNYPSVWAAAKLDYYTILGVAKNASEDDIKKAYRRMAMKHHPDRFSAESKDVQKQNEEKFKEAKEAYETLSDSSKRAAYDEYGPAASDQYGSSRRRSGGPENWSDPFGDARQSYSASEKVMRALLSTQGLSVQQMFDVAMRIWQAEIQFTGHLSQLEINLRMNAIADIFTRLGAMVDHRFDVMEAAYKSAFLHLKSVATISRSTYDYYYKYGYDYLASIYKISNDRPTRENLRYRQHMYEVLTFAERTRIQDFSYVRTTLSDAQCAEFLRTATFTDAHGHTFTIPINITIKVGF